MAKRYQNSANAYREEAASLRSRIDYLESEEKVYQKKVSTAELKLRELDEKLRSLQGQHAAQIADKDRLLEAKIAELGDLMLEYQELYDIKVTLDMEIAAYRKLLEAEEQRLNISTLDTSSASTAVSPSTSSKTRGGAKKRRLQEQEQEEIDTSFQYIQTQQNTCGLEIDLHDQTGSKVRLVNTSGDKDVNVSGWKLSRKANENKSEFKFGKSVAVIKPGQHLTVWSSESAPAKQSLTPQDFVMPQGQKWHVADAMVTVLVDKEDNVNSFLFSC